jgi:hypothetical protein
VKFFRPDLHEHRSDENHAEDCGSNEITGAFRFVRCFAEPRHRDRIAAGFAERGRENLDDPEQQRDLRHFCDELGFRSVHWISDARDDLKFNQPMNRA